jgi:hypothetical protein
MSRVKVLKGVAHNVGSSFTSLMNYTGNDYSMGHVLRFARESGIHTLTIDLLQGKGHPDSLLKEPISRLPEWYSKMFFHLVQSAGSDRALVHSGTLKLTYDLHRTRPSANRDEPESPYTCEVSIVDIRGKEYLARFEGWWFVERMAMNRPLSPDFRKWWNPFTWARSR